MKKQHVLLRYWLPMTLLMVFMFSLSSLRNIQTHMAVPDDTLKSVAHILEYLALSVITFRFCRELEPRTSVIFTIIVVALFAVLDEMHQALVPTRTPSIEDLLMDYIGMLAGLICAGVYLKFSKSSKQS